jgi:hypothetical protein
LIIIKHFSESKETMQDPHVFQGRHMQQPYVAPLRHIFPWINPLQTAPGAEFNSGCCRLQFPGVHFVWLFRPWPVSRRRCWWIDVPTVIPKRFPGLSWIQYVSIFLMNRDVLFYTATFFVCLQGI